MATADTLVLQDLYNRVGAARIVQYFDDDGDGDVSDESTQVQSTLAAAEGYVYALMLRGGWDKAAVIALIEADEVAREMLSWIAVELSSERRAEFTSPEGWGAYRIQYERAEKYFERLSKGKIRSQGESVAGRNAHIGGQVQPAPPSGTGDDFVFAPSKNAPTGRGGFILPLGLAFELVRFLMVSLA